MRLHILTIMTDKNNLSFSDNSFSLAKGLHHINIAKLYFEDVRFGTNKDIKAIFNQYILKCDWILSNVKNRLNPESREALEKELTDSFTFDAINDKLIYLDNTQREFIETILDAIIAGEERAHNRTSVGCSGSKKQTVEGI